MFELEICRRNCGKDAFVNGGGLRTLSGFRHRRLQDGLGWEDCGGFVGVFSEREVEQAERRIATTGS